MATSRIATLLSSAHAFPGKAHTHGLTGAAQALVILHELINTNRSCVVLCPNDDIARDLTLDIESLSTALFEGKPRAIHLPTWEQSPYTSVTPAIRTRLARLGALEHTLSPDLPQVFVSTLAATWQTTLPKEIFLEKSTLLHPEKNIEDRETLAVRLTDAGYLRVDTVEDPGTFAIRGEIVDVFPAHADSPLRIELLGDSVERLRFFDPQSQRTVSSPLSKDHPCRVPPAREVLINAKTLALIRERLKSFADDAEISRAIRDPILSAVQVGIYPAYSDAWAPFAYEKPATFWDYLPSERIIFWVDAPACHEEFSRFLEQQRSFAAEMGTHGLIIPSVDVLFQHPPLEDGHFLSKRTLLCLDRIELTDLNSLRENTEAASHTRPLIQVNTDLSSGTRHSLGDLEPVFRLWLKQGFKIVAFASTQSQVERIRFLLSERHLPCQINGPPHPSFITLVEGTLSAGFRWPAEGLVLITESEILGSKHVRKASSRKKSSSASKDWAGLQALSDLSTKDLVVHVDHGIGRYQGLVRLSLSGAPSDFLLLEYANKDRLYLPVYRLNVIQKYISPTESTALDRLGSQRFSKVKEKVRDAVKQLAINLVQLYAQRKVAQGTRHSPRDSSFHEFEAQFPFDETPDQLKAIEDTLNDLETGKVMDRLICGDVGYGKTEVAIRAAFRAVTDGKQVAVLVPTTVLANQHELSFKSRLKDYPIVIDSLSRFKSTKEQKVILENLATGKVDIVIGTHRLLSRDVSFRDLGLLVVDEEHRFGVEHKERLKALRVCSHVLTLTATPIPRTLHMALAGLRDISLITTPPLDRLPIRTYVAKYDEALISRAVAFELSRGGQVFFVHNRVQTIDKTAAKLQELLPDAKVLVAHGQMGDAALEKAMLSFYRKETNVLVCTSIIESGLDLPSANTIIINRADTFGLAQLYQIRGRVGRGQQRAYCYLLIPQEGAVTEEAKRRLEVIQRFIELGSGFSIASHDLEIRGGGDLLGPQQSGHIEAVGFDLYTELLEEAIHELQGKPILPEESSREPEIKAPFPSFLAEDYLPDVHQRLSLYRRLSATQSEEEIQLIEEELKDRFGPLPIEAQNLLWLIRLKLLLKTNGVATLTIGAEKSTFSPDKISHLDPTRAIQLMSANPAKYQITPDSKFIAHIPSPTLRDFYFEFETLITTLKRPASTQ